MLYSPGCPRVLPVPFTIPTTDGVHYVTSTAPAVTAGQTITMKFSLAGSGKLIATQGDQPARVRLMLQQQGDTLTAEEEDKRWWSYAHIELTPVPGEFLLTATVQPDQWFQVFGHSGADRPGAFANCLLHLGNWGFTFGGMFAGHGVYATGPVTFTLKQFSVQ